MNRDRVIPLLTHVKVRGPGGCWPWQGGRRLTFRGRQTTPARAVQEAMFGVHSVRDRRVLHACGVQGCVNPAHLEVRHKWDRGPYRVVVIDESGPQREHNPLWWDWEREILHLGKDWRTLVSFRFVSGEWERVGTRPELDRRWRGPL